MSAVFLYSQLKSDRRNVPRDQADHGLEGGREKCRGRVGLGVRVVDHAWMFSNMCMTARGEGLLSRCPCLGKRNTNQ